MSLLNLVTIIAGTASGWVGARLGATRISAIVVLPASLGIAYGLLRLIALVLQPITDQSGPTPPPFAFALLLLLSLVVFYQVARRGRGQALTPAERYAGFVLGAWSWMVVCAVAAVFAANSSAGRAVISSSWLWTLLSTAELV